MILLIVCLGASKIIVIALLKAAHNGVSGHVDTYIFGHYLN